MTLNEITNLTNAVAAVLKWFAVVLMILRELCQSAKNTMTWFNQTLKKGFSFLINAWSSFQPPLLPIPTPIKRFMVYLMVFASCGLAIHITLLGLGFIIIPLWMITPEYSFAALRIALLGVIYLGVAGFILRQAKSLWDNRNTIG